VGWNHLKNEELKGHQARTKVELKQLAQEKLQGMSDNHKLVKGLFWMCSRGTLVKTYRCTLLVLR